MKKVSIRYIYYYTIILILLTILYACSSTRFFYSFLDEFIQNEVEYFFNLNDEEGALLNQQVSDMISWHRKHMLLNYSDYLYNVSDMLELDQYEDTEIENTLENGRALIEQTVIGFTPYASKFLVQHQTSEAINFMEKQMEKRQQEQQTELSEPRDKVYQERLNSLKTNFKRFLGSLTSEQVALLEVYALKTLEDAKIRLDNRTMRQKAFITFMKTQPNEVKLTIYLNQLILNGHEIINPSYKSFSETWQNRFRQLLVGMLAISSNSQRKAIVVKLRSYASDFKDISE